MTKVSIIGAGAIGSNVAFLLGQKGDYNLQLIDIDADFALGKALDLSQALVAENIQNKTVIRGSDKVENIRGSDVIVITAGISRRPGMNRSDLIEANAVIIRNIASAVRQYASHSFVIVVTNPLDSLTWLFQKVSGLPVERIIGMAGGLDQARFAYFLSEVLDVNPTDIKATVVGLHSDDMMPLIRFTTIGGIPLKCFIQNGKITEEVVANVIRRTRQGGAEIVNLMKTGSAYFAPASAVKNLVESYIYDQKKVITASVSLSNTKFGKDVYMGMPVVIGCSGIEEVHCIELDEFEQKSLERSISKVAEINQSLIVNPSSKPFMRK